VAGTALAAIVLDDLDELVGTQWGRVLIAKVLFVAAAASIGAYNHFVVLRSAPTDETEDSAVSGRLRRLVVAEAAILLLVIGVTAVLIQSNSGA